MSLNEWMSRLRKGYMMFFRVFMTDFCITDEQTNGWLDERTNWRTLIHSFVDAFKNIQLPFISLPGPACPPSCHMLIFGELKLMHYRRTEEPTNGWTDKQPYRWMRSAPEALYQKPWPGTDSHIFLSSRCFATTKVISVSHRNKVNAHFVFLTLNPSFFFTYQNFQMVFERPVDRRIRKVYSEANYW